MCVLPDFTQIQADYSKYRLDRAKLGLTSSSDLAREGDRISKKKALELFESGMLDKLEAGKFSALKAIQM